MKTGKSLMDIAAELTRQAETKKDYIAPQGAIEAVVVDDDRAIALDGINGNPFPLTSHAHGQLSTVLGIPQKYYDRMRVEQPELLTRNINTWLKAEPDAKRMIRTLDGRARGILSPKYRPLDNFELATAVLPTLRDAGVEIVSSELTETRMYIKGILPKLSDEIAFGTLGVGHDRVDRGTVVAAVVIANSEVGAGTLRIEPSVFTTGCTNLMILAEAAMRKYHVGKAFDADDSREVFRDATRQADDRAFFMKVTDITRAAFDERAFRAAIAELRNKADVKIASKELPKVVEVAVKRLALPSGTQGSILTHLAAGGDLTQWGLSSAITRVANDFEDYEGATLLERAGGEVLALPARDWEAISNAV